MSPGYMVNSSHRSYSVDPSVDPSRHSTCVLYKGVNKVRTKLFFQMKYG